MENNVCRALAPSNETDTARNGNGANSPALVVKNPQAKHAPFKYTPQYHVGSIPEATQEPDKKYRAQHQQFRLFHDERRYQLFKEYKLIEERVPNTHCADMSDASHHIIERGLPARVWTVGGEGSERVGFPPDAKSEFGPCDCAYDEADYLLLTEKEHNTWASYQPNRPKPVVLRDQEFNRRRPGKTTNKWMKEMMRFASSNELLVDVQLLNKKDSSIAVEKIPLRQAITDWRKTQGRAHIDEENMPMNLLNISDIKPGHWPEGLSKNYALLFDAIERCDGLIYQDLHPEGETELGIGKPGTLAYSHCDIQKCAQFRILAQRGAMSSWHIDNLGVYTFVHLEGNTGDDDEQDEDVVKYWPIFPLHHLTEEAKQEALADFAKPLMEGGSTKWRPKPKEGIRVISLTRGDMLIQPPGTIHAPITLTDCFFLGGMAWKRSTMKQTMAVWEHLARNEDCTNENLPRQAQAILEYLENEVKESPGDFNLDTEEERENFQRQCGFIYGMVGRCYCKTPCYKNATCSCRLRKVKCGARCHKNGQQKKANPDSKTCLDHPDHAAKPKPKPKSNAKPQPEPEVEYEEFEPEAVQAEKPKRPHKEEIEEDCVPDTQPSKSRKINRNSTPASMTSDASTALPRTNKPCEKCRSDIHNTNYLGPNGRTLCRRCNKDWMADGRDPDWKGIQTRAHQSENSFMTAVAKRRHEYVGERLLRENTLVRPHTPEVENPLRREKRRRDLGFLDESSSRESSAEPTEHDKSSHCSGCDKTRTHEWHDSLPNQENEKDDSEYQGKSWCNKCYYDSAKAMVDLERKMHEYDQKYPSGSKPKARGADTTIDLAPMVPPNAHKPSAPSSSKGSRKTNGTIEQHVMDGLPRLVWKGKGNEPCRGCGTTTPLQGWHGGMGGHCKPCYRQKGKILDAYTPPGWSALRTVLTPSSGAALGQSTQSNGTLNKQDRSKEGQSCASSRSTSPSSATGVTKDMAPATDIRRISGSKESTESNLNGFRKSSTQFITIDGDEGVQRTKRRGHKEPAATASQSKKIVDKETSLTVTTAIEPKTVLDEGQMLPLDSSLSLGFQELEGAERSPSTELTNTAAQGPSPRTEPRQAELATDDVKEEPMSSGDQKPPVATTKSNQAKLAGPCCKCGSKEHRKGFRDHFYQEEPSTTGDQWCFKCYDNNYRQKRRAQKLRIIQADEPGDVIMTDSRLGQRPVPAREDTVPVKSEGEEVQPTINPVAKKRTGVKATGPCCVCNDATATKYAVSLYNEDAPADGRQWCKRCYDKDYKAKNGREPSGVKIRLGSNAKEVLSREPSETPLIQSESPAYHGAASEPGTSLKTPGTEEAEPSSNAMGHKKAADKAPSTNRTLHLPNNRDPQVSIGELSCVKCQNTFNKPGPWHSHLLGEPDLADGGLYCHPCCCNDGTKKNRAKKWDEAPNNGNNEQGNAPNDNDKNGTNSPILPANPLERKRSSTEYEDDVDAEDEQESRVKIGWTDGGKPSESSKGKYSEQRSKTRGKYLYFPATLAEDSTNRNTVVPRLKGALVAEPRTSNST